MAKNVLLATAAHLSLDDPDFSLETWTQKAALGPAAKVRETQRGTGFHQLFMELVDNEGGIANAIPWRSQS